jgi:asparagine synthase (glutamine-hydrolysing)
MAATLSHRGPDDSGVFVAGSVGLGFRRLSIIDLTGGHQPMMNEAGDVAVVMNGEIYNFRRLRSELEDRGHRFSSRSDTEVLVHLYEERGADVVQDLVGMFGFAVADLRGEWPSVLLGRDRLGIKPLYYAETENGLLWASEPKAILELGETRRRLRAKSLLDFLMLGYVGGEDSAWEGIKRLPPGHVLRWQPGERVNVQRYWDLPTHGLREPAGTDEVLEWLDLVVRDRLVADVPLGAFLSGGIDSSAVVTSMARCTGESVIACSVGFADNGHDETATAAITAGLVGARHHTAKVRADPALAVDVLPWFFDEPHADSSIVPTYLVSKMAREHVTVALSGDGGDETFAGYRNYVHDVAENRLRRLGGRAGQGLFGLAGRVYPQLDWAPRFLRAKTFLTNVGDDPAHAYWRSVCQLDRSAALAMLHPDLAASLVDYDPFLEFEQHYRRPEVDDPLYRAQYADFHTWLPNQVLAKVDRASMANSLEVRVPILDHRFCGRFANLPADQKIQHGRGKRLFREAVASRLPREVLEGPKRGFESPIGNWIRGPLKDAVAGSIETLPGHWFDRAHLARMHSEHCAGRRNHDRALWSLLILESWRRRHQVEDIVN